MSPAHAHAHAHYRATHPSCESRSASQVGHQPALLLFLFPPFTIIFPPAIYLLFIVFLP